ncbi:hypothetical protein EYM_01280 [Ignicoccus islandicus DSM 13165]|uniref:EamA domain-containing protein n=1 Tax=Ignicoccus islandicus DSM 13165 TaxID=940295 RepID=A0A0U2U7W6_9CREN|nr:EamA family transporter [Ignicoccus islandicus]ALU12196.1 hypothetical protein EYM_01280 [Ignicoccus islandicus DSM 13165]
MLEAAIPLIPQLLWATNFVISKIVVSSGLHPLALTAIRWTIATFLMYLYARLVGMRISLDRSLSFLALTGITGFSALIYLGLMFSKASIVGLTMAFIPIATSILAAIFLKERISKLVAASVVLGSLGGILLSAGNLNGLSWLGVLFGVLASIDWGIYTVWSKKAMVELSPMELLVSISILAQPVNWILALPFLSIEPLLKEEVLLGTLYVSLVPGFVAYFLWLYSVKLIGASRAGVYINALPLFTLIISVLTLGERLDAFEVAGSALIIAALTLVTVDYLNRTYRASRQ